jgi:ribose transport system permease protein
MRQLFRTILRDYTTLIMLLLLAAVLSAATLGRQFPTGAEAGRQLAALIAGDLPPGAGVLIVVRPLPDDRLLAAELESRLLSDGFRVVNTVIGEPADAGQALRDAQATGQSIAAIAGTDVTTGWPVFDNLGQRFPEMSEVRVVRPQSYLWPNFLKRDNLLNIANQIAVIAIVAIGMTLVIIGGGIDLSVGSLIALSAVTCAMLVRDVFGGPQAGTLGLLVAGLGAIGLTAAVGAFTGTLVAYARVQPFIVTLALLSIARGWSYLQSSGATISQLPPAIKWLGSGANLLGIPNAVVLMIGLYILADLAMKRTVFGRHLYAVGGNEQAARLCGIPVQRILLFTYVLSGAFAGLGGVILCSQFQSGSPNYGRGYELGVIAAVVVGGTSLSGGSGRMFGTLQGALLIAVVQNGMNLKGLGSYSQEVVLGGVILVAALLDRAKVRWLGGRAES